MKPKELIVAVLVLVMAFCVASCSQTEEAESFNLDLLASDETMDLGGYQCDIYQSYTSDRPFQYPENTLLADLYLKRLADIGNELNCSITITPGEAYLQDAISKIYAGVRVGEIACTHQPSELVRGGALYPLDVLRDRLDYMNSEKFGSLGMLEMGMLNGVPHTVSPMLWPGKQASYSYNIFAINESIVKKYNLTDPRDYVENGTWTWDTFANCLADYEISDGDYTAKSLNATWTFTLEAAFMNGADYISDKNGVVSANLGSPEIAQAFDWCSKLFTEQANYITFLDHASMVEEFINKRLVITQTSFTHIINDIIYDVDDYGVVPFPCGPNGTYGEWRSAFSDFDSMGIFVNAKEPEAAAIIIDKMFEPLDGYETPADIAKYASTIFYDSRDVDLFTTYLEDIRWNYWTVGIFDYFGNAKAMCRNGTSSAEIIGRYTDAANLIVDKYVVPNYDFIRQYQASK